MRIVFLCPPATTINGGIKQIFRMAECLLAQGRDAVVFEETRTRPVWFASTAPVVGQEIFGTRDAVWVLPEDQPHILRDFADLPQRKVVYSQNHFYGARGLGGGETYDRFGVTDILCASRTIYDHCTRRHPRTRAHLVSCLVDRQRFAHGEAKQDTIAFMPRKRPIEAIYIKDMACFLHPEFAHWSWVEIDGADEANVAAALRQAKVFLALGRLEGLGLAPMEAMAAGCVVAGFTGIGGREYATAANGFWADNDDCDAVVTALRQAVGLAIGGGMALTAYRAACDTTLSAFTPDGFAAATARAWAHILG